MQFSRALILILLPATLHAENFEIIDGGAQITGKPNISRDKAQASWDTACDKWKTETKELNKNDALMQLSCESPNCASDQGIVTCKSDALFKVRVVGTRVQPQPPPAPVVQPPPQETVIQTVAASPTVIYETVPDPRPGFIWVGGSWGWHDHYRHWYPGYWNARPGYVWSGPHHHHYGHHYWH